MTTAIRLFTWDDLPAIANAMNTYSESLGRPGTMTVEQVEQSWRSPYNHPDRDCFVALDADNHLIGFTIADLLDDPARAIGVYNVPPTFRDVADDLIHAAENHFVSMANERVAPGTSLNMQWRVSDKDATALALLAEGGYQHVRAFYTMQITLDQPIDPVSLPDGFTLSPFTPDHLEALFAAKTETFRDHWGEQDQTLEEWHIDINQPEFDPSLWWIAYSGDDIAGMVLSRATSPTSAWVDIVGVRRAWRQRGLAYTLLRQCFAEYQRRSVQNVYLGVDTGSLSNAVALYERAGMHVYARQLYYEKAMPIAVP